MGQQRLVGLEDFVVLVGVAIHRQRNRTQGVALFHHDKAGRRDSRTGNGDLVINTRNAGNIAQRQQYFLFLFLAGDFTCHGHLVTVDGGLHIGVTQPNLGHVIF